MVVIDLVFIRVYTPKASAASGEVGKLWWKDYGWALCLGRARATGTNQVGVPIHAKEGGAKQQKLRYQDEHRVVNVACGRQQQGQQAQHYRHYPRAKSKLLFHQQRAHSRGVKSPLPFREAGKGSQREGTHGGYS